MPIDLILHTPGGLVLATEQIARALLRHSAKVTVFIPHYAMSGDTMLAMAADEIVMDENAVLGPVDPQIDNVAAASILTVLEAKPPEKIDDQTLITADVARKAVAQVQRFVRALLEDSIPRQKVDPANIDKINEGTNFGLAILDFGWVGADRCVCPWVDLDFGWVGADRCVCPWVDEVGVSKTGWA